MNSGKTNKETKKKLRAVLKDPSLIERFSGALTALGCTFVLSANNNVYCFYPALRESRRLKLGIELAFIMAHITYGSLAGAYIISEVLLGIDGQKYPLIAQYHFYCLILVVFPLICISCLAIPWNMEILMKRMVMNRRQSNHLPYQIYFLKVVFW